MDYKSAIGEKIIKYDGTLGVITAVDISGCIHIRFDGESTSGCFMFDPFLNENVKFVDSVKQKEIDEEIEKIDNDEKEIINNFKSNSIADETFFITIAKDDTPHHENGLQDKVIGLSCSKEDAYKAFHYYITQQSRNMRKTGNKDGFHQVGLYDSKTGKKISQES